MLFAESIESVDSTSHKEEQIFNSPRREEKEITEPKVVRGKQLCSKVWEQVDYMQFEEPSTKKPDLNVSLCLTTTDRLRKAKQRLEDCFVDDYFGKIKPFKREERGLRR